VLVFYPPVIGHVLTWRSLYRSGAFAQRELIESGMFNNRAKERGTDLGIGDGSLIYLHEVGALRPVAFAGAPLWSGMRIPPESDEQMIFSDENPGVWSDYEYELDGYPRVSALYTPWQQLPAIDAVDAAGFTLPLWVVAGDADAGARALEQMRGWATMQNERWRGLDDAWRPLLIALVRLQNRYLPDLTRRSTLLFDTETRQRVDPFTRELETFDAKQVFERDFCADRDGLLAAYHFLVDRGLSRDPQDGLTMLRRARPRAFHIRWSGEPRRAQDHFDAADIIRRFLVDVDGRQPPQADAIPMDGRQNERAALYERGPGAPWTGADVVGALQEADLYPHGVHVVHEGDSEQIMTEILIASIMGSGILEEVRFTDLGGAGNAGVVGDLVGSLDGYARRVTVIIDAEVKARTHVEAAIASGGIAEQDVLLFDTSLEEANATDEELVTLAATLAAENGEELALTAAALREFHDKRVRRARGRNADIPGLASSLQQVVSRATAGRWHLRKPDLIEQLAVLIAEEMHSLPRAEWSRPVAVFVADRLIPPLNRPYPVGLS